MVDMANPRTATVHLIDPDSALAVRLRALLGGEARVLQYRSAGQFLEESPDERPACVVMEANLPGEESITFIEEFRKRPCAPPVIVFAEQISVRKAVEAMSHGAHFVLEKSGDLATLKCQVQCALERDAADYRRYQENAGVQERLQTLSQRERQVADLIFNGLETKEIAVRLGISTKTVDYHRGQIFNKIGVSNPAQLVAAMFQVDGRAV